MMYGYGNYGGMGYGNSTNPYQPQIDRLNQMQQMQQMQQQQQVSQQPQGNSVIPVGSIEEVKAFNNYFDGQVHYFVDTANNKIYTKVLGINGIPSIQTYSLVVEEEKKVEYATKEEVQNLKNVIDDLLGKMRGVENE